MPRTRSLRGAKRRGNLASVVFRGGIASLALAMTTGFFCGSAGAQTDNGSHGGIAEQWREAAVRLVKNEKGAWQLIVHGEPYIIRGMEYSADVVGRSPDGNNGWMQDDINGNIACDGPYDAWVDANRDEYQDAEEENVGDFKLLQEMGCNTIRIYHPENIDIEILRDLFKTYGIRVIMGNFLGAYTKGSEANWEDGTDYTSEEQREKMKESVRAMVTEYKDEPFLLMWLLGNENDAEGSYGNSTYNNTNAASEPEVYAKFVNEVALMIKELDPDHPVGVCNARTKLLPYYADHAPDIDYVGFNSYAGPFGFSTIWNRVRKELDRPVLITEYGCDSYNEKKREEDETYQAGYHRRAWRDIETNSYLGEKAGNAIGGVIFCWLDKWWVCGASSKHDIEQGKWRGPKADGFFHDEWLGMCGQGKGTRSPFLRQPRKVYYLYRDELWGDPEASSESDPVDISGNDPGNDPENTPENTPVINPGNVPENIPEAAPINEDQ